MFDGNKINKLITETGIIMGSILASTFSNTTLNAKNVHKLKR
jgi:hypothetical protein